MTTALTVGCKDCGRQLKFFEPALIQRLSKGRGCTFCGGALDVPERFRVGAAALGAAAPIATGRCVGCLRPLRPGSDAIWSCYVCGTRMLAPPRPSTPRNHTPV